MARIPGEPDVAVVATSVEANAPSSIDWAAVIAGAFLANDVIAKLDAFVADEYRRPGNELPHLMLAFAAE